jgi:hypothetical protein
LAKVLFYASYSDPFAVPDCGAHNPDDPPGIASDIHELGKRRATPFA